MSVHSLPTRAQLLELRRAGVTQWRCTKDGVTLELQLRSLPSGRQVAQRSKPQRPCITSTKVGGEGAARAAACCSARLSRGQRRRRNIAANKAAMAVHLQRVARGLLARAATRRARLRNELLVLNNEIKARKKAAIAAKENIKIKPATVATARVVGFQRISRSSEPKRKRTVRVPVHAPGPSAEREPPPTSTKPSASPVLKDGNTHARYGGYLYDVLEDVVL